MHRNRCVGGRQGLQDGLHFSLVLGHGILNAPDVRLQLGDSLVLGGNRVVHPLHARLQQIKLVTQMR